MPSHYLNQCRPSSPTHICGTRGQRWVKCYKDDFDLLNVVIEDGEIRAAIKELQRGKSAGEDGIINELFIYGEAALTPYLTVLFNFVFENGIFPNEWTKGLLVPLHKKGSINIKENYRGITLLSVVGKLFTRVLNNRLNKWAESYGIYVDAQYGFRKGRSTVDCIFILHQLINDYVARSKSCMCFLSISVKRLTLSCAITCGLNYYKLEWEVQC